MSCRRTALLALLVLGVAHTSAGDQRDAVDVSKLPLNLARIERQLRQTTVREEHDGLNLRYVVDVYGKAPRIEFFTRQDNLLSGPVPYGAPTHRQILEVITPQEYRAPAADFTGLLRWLAGKSKDASSK